MESKKDNQQSTKEQVDKKDKNKKADDVLGEEDLVSEIDTNFLNYSFTNDL